MNFLLNIGKDMFTSEFWLFPHWDEIGGAKVALTSFPIVFMGKT